MSYENRTHSPIAPVPPESGAGPTVPEEEELLAIEFGAPNEDGLYGTVIAE
ncbi:hypothetical protein OV450_3434 [Actinobacteria bacterium OV450]|nr:hypothetical protein OV450_3434 [Actinobacteria bacterium OV450]